MSVTDTSQFDVVVVGAGVAGLTAAVSAAEAGRRNMSACGRRDMVCSAASSWETSRCPSRSACTWASRSAVRVFSRCSICGTGRTSPPKPSSPIASVPGGRGRFM